MTRRLSTWGGETASAMSSFSHVNGVSMAANGRLLGVQAVVTFEKFSPSAVAGTHFDIPPEYVLQSEAG